MKKKSLEMDELALKYLKNENGRGKNVYEKSPASPAFRSTDPRVVRQASNDHGYDFLRRNFFRHIENSPLKKMQFFQPGDPRGKVFD